MSRPWLDKRLVDWVSRRRRVWKTMGGIVYAGKKYCRHRRPRLNKRVLYWLSRERRIWQTVGSVAA